MHWAVVQGGGKLQELVLNRVGKNNKLAVLELFKDPPPFCPYVGPLLFPPPVLIYERSTLLHSI